MGVFGLRLDIFILIWFISMGIVNYLEDQTGVFDFRREPKYNITAISQMQGITVGGENTTASDYLEPKAQPEDSSFLYLDSVTYAYKAGTFIMSTLWNATFGFHTFLRDTFGIPYMPWGLPLMILINLVNFLGLIELWTRLKV